MRYLDKAFLVASSSDAYRENYDRIFDKSRPSRYQTVWMPHSRNEAFWREVLVGRKIASIIFDEKGLRQLVLDSGEVVDILGTVGITE